MTVYREVISLDTLGENDMTDISKKVESIIKRSSILEGIVNIFNVGSTGVIGTIEFEPGLKKDLPKFLNNLIPPGRNYGHELTWHDGNGHSHLQATLMGPSVTIPVGDNKMLNGTWQQIFHYEADNKPRKRDIIVTVTGD